MCQVREVTKPALSASKAASPRALPDMESIQGAMSGFLDSLSDASERGREALARCMSPLTLTPKTNGPGRFEASGTIDLAKVVASGSSGGAQPDFPDTWVPIEKLLA